MSEVQVPLQLVVDEYRKQLDDVNYRLTVNRIAMKTLQSENERLKLENENLKQEEDF